MMKMMVSANPTIAKVDLDLIKCKANITIIVAKPRR